MQLRSRTIVARLLLLAVALTVHQGIERQARGESNPVREEPSRDWAIFVKPQSQPSSEQRIVNSLCERKGGHFSAVENSFRHVRLLQEEDDEGDQIEYRINDSSSQFASEPLSEPRATPLPPPDALEDLPPFDGPAEQLPPFVPEDVGGEFPPLPPDPYETDQEPLPPLEYELWMHGGAHLYVPEGDRRNWPADFDESTHHILRLPEEFVEPRPLTAFQGFLAADAPQDWPRLRWPGGGYSWEPRFVGYGSYELFAFALEENSRRQDVLGHQLIVELDLRLTGTERFHVQFRPLGERNTGGSFYQFSDPEGYVDNSTGVPDRYWFEGELHSILGSYLDPFAVRDFHFVAGRFPFALHNALLMNTEMTGFAVNKNTIYLGLLSNLNVQAFVGLNDLTAFSDADADLYGMHVSADHDRVFYEATYAFLQHNRNSARDSHFAALSRTVMRGPWSLAGRAMFKWGDRGGRGSGQLFVLESNWTRVFERQPLGIERGVFFCNAFLATGGWNSIAGGNFNRLRTSFEVDPLVRIAAGRDAGDNWGAALGVQLFRRHEDESLIPEIAFESPEDTPVLGLGLRYFRKTGPRSFLELLLSFNLSDDSRFDREGVFLSETISF